MTKITINTYKESGKWYDEIKYESNIEVWDMEALIKEAKTKCLQTRDMNFTLLAERGIALSHWLITK